MNEEKHDLGEAPHTAAEWLVALEAGADADVAARFDAWLAADDSRARELERAETAVTLARALAADPELRWAYDEAAALARPAPAARHRPAERGWLGRLAWSAGAVAALAVAIAAMLRAPDVPSASHTAPAAHVDIGRAAGIVANTPNTNAAAVLAGDVVVDARSVAVLPFAPVAMDGDDAAASGGLAASMHRDLLASLRAVTGLYVIGEPSVSPYASTTLTAPEIGAQLGARGVVDAAVAVESGGRVRVAVRLTDASTGAVLWREQYDRPAEELRAIQVDVVENVTSALVAPRVRIENTIAAIVAPRSMHNE